MSSLLAPSRRLADCQKVVRARRPSLMIFCCSNSFTKKMYQEPTDMMAENDDGRLGDDAALLEGLHETELGGCVRQRRQVLVLLTCD